MGISLTRIQKSVDGNRRTRRYAAAMTGTYNAGGESIIPGAVGLRRIDYVSVSSSSAGYIFEAVVTGGLIAQIKAYRHGVVGLADAPLTEVTGGVDITAANNIRLEIVGK